MGYKIIGPTLLFYNNCTLMQKLCLGTTQKRLLNENTAKSIYTNNVWE